MKVSDAVASRMSVRAFLDTPVDGALLRRIIAQAARAASGGNLQPWIVHVLAGDPLCDFLSRMKLRLASGESGQTEFPTYPPRLKEPYRSRRFEVGKQMYDCMGIAYEDKAARLAWLANNYAFFGAPVGMFCYVDRDMGAAQWSDLGMYLATPALLLREAGLDCCFHEAWARYHPEVDTAVGPAPGHMLFCGVAIGYCDPNAPVNALQSTRAPLDEFATFHGAAVHYWDTDIRRRFLGQDGADLIGRKPS